MKLGDHPLDPLIVSALESGAWPALLDAWPARRTLLTTRHPWLRLLWNVRSLVQRKNPIDRQAIDEALAQHLPALMAPHMTLLTEWAPRVSGHLGEHGLMHQAWGAGANNDGRPEDWPLLARVIALDLPRTAQGLLAMGADPWLDVCPRKGHSAWVRWAKTPSHEFLDALLAAGGQPGTGQAVQVWTNVLRFAMEPRSHTTPLVARKRVHACLPRLVEGLPLTQEQWQQVWLGLGHPAEQHAQWDGRHIMAMMAMLPDVARQAWEQPALDAEQERYLQAQRSVWRLHQADIQTLTAAPNDDDSEARKALLTQLLAAGDVQPKAANNDARWAYALALPADAWPTASPVRGKTWWKLWRDTSFPPAEVLRQAPASFLEAIHPDPFSVAYSVQQARWLRDIGVPWTGPGRQFGWLHLLERALEKRDAPFVEWCLDERVHVPEHAQQVGGLDWRALLAMRPLWRGQHTQNVSPGAVLIAAAATGNTQQARAMIKKGALQEPDIHETAVNLVMRRWLGWQEPVCKDAPRSLALLDHQPWTPCMETMDSLMGGMMAWWETHPHHQVESTYNTPIMKLWGKALMALPSQEWPDSWTPFLWFLVERSHFTYAAMTHALRVSEWPESVVQRMADYAVGCEEHQAPSVPWSTMDTRFSGERVGVLLHAGVEPRVLIGVHHRLTNLLEARQADPDSAEREDRLTQYPPMQAEWHSAWLSATLQAEVPDAKAAAGGGRKARL